MSLLTGERTPRWGTWTRGRRCAFDDLCELVHKRNLPRHQLAPGLRKIKPPAAIHFRKFLLLPRLWRPLHSKRIATKHCRVSLPFNSPCGDDFSTWLFDRLEWHEGPVN